MKLFFAHQSKVNIMPLLPSTIAILTIVCAFQFEITPNSEPLTSSQTTMIRSLLGEIPDLTVLNRGVKLKSPLTGIANDTIIDHKYSVSFDRLLAEDGKLILLPSKSAVHGKAIFFEEPPTRIVFDTAKYANIKKMLGNSRGGIDGWNDGLKDHWIEQWRVFTVQCETLTFFDIRAFVSRLNGEAQDKVQFESISIVECQLAMLDEKATMTPTN
jgi:hypothetical protein